MTVTEHEARKSEGQRAKVGRRVDWLLLAWMALELFASMMFIGAALVVALASLATSLRLSRSGQLAVWGFAVVLTIATTLPALGILFNWNFAEETRFVVGGE